MEIAYVFGWSPREICDLPWLDFVNSILWAEGMIKAKAEGSGL